MVVTPRGQNSTAPTIRDYIPHLFGCSPKAQDPDAPSSGITKQVEKPSGRLISKHSDKGLPPPLCLPVWRLIIAQHYAFPRKPSPHHIFFQVLVSLRNSHIQMHDVILKFTHQNEFRLHLTYSTGLIVPQMSEPYLLLTLSAYFCFFDKHYTLTSSVKTLICRSNHFQVYFGGSWRYITQEDDKWSSPCIVASRVSIFYLINAANSIVSVTEREE